MTENRKYPKVRVTEQAHAHLTKLVPELREIRGVNVSMTDIASEAILSIPLPTLKDDKKKRRPRKAEPSAVVTA